MVDIPASAWINSDGIKAFSHSAGADSGCRSCEATSGWGARGKARARADGGERPQVLVEARGEPTLGAVHRS